MFWIWCTEHFDWLDGLSWFVAHQNIKRSLYFTFLRSHLMFCSQVLRPFLIKDSRALEKLQMRAAKYTVKDSSLDYNSKLLNLNIFHYHYWWNSGYLLFVIKWLKFLRIMFLYSIISPSSAHLFNHLPPLKSNLLIIQFPISRPLITSFS